jgi:hypothetical protein
MRAYRRQLSSTATALEYLLDDLEHERTAPSPLDLLLAR